jgi:hypothetical protein
MILNAPEKLCWALSRMGPSVVKASIIDDQ